jgi:RimJ/RimL family protein N-acetyltransferase
VWEHNPRAQAFYAKCGFVQAGTKPFVVGTDVQNDWVMLRRFAGEE